MDSPHAPRGVNVLRLDIDEYRRRARCFKRQFEISIDNRHADL